MFVANGAQPVAYLILAAAPFTIVGMSLALYRRGR